MTLVTIAQVDLQALPVNLGSQEDLGYLVNVDNPVYQDQFQIIWELLKQLTVEFVLRDQKGQMDKEDNLELL